MRQVEIKRLAGYLVTAVGVVMVAVSVYYLAAYMRSGSDAAEFNLEVADSHQRVLLGLEAPRPHSSGASEVVSLSIEDDNVSDAAVNSDLIEPQEVVFVESPAFLEKESAEKPLAGGGSEIVSFHVARAEAVTYAVPSDSSVAASTVQLDVDLFASLYPGGNMNPRYWGDPQWAGNLPFGGQSIPEGFVPVDSSHVAPTSASEDRGVRMRIPAINLDAAVSELEILDLGDSRQWSTPDRVVGHIPHTANPGEARRGWYFGHLDNFISNEGDIFRRLPEISEMIKYDPVDIFITTSEAEYMYRVTGTRQLHRDDLQITQASDAQIVLVTCWPFRVYDQRILVNASLIAVRSLS